jgi:Sulfotransferase domain
VQVRSELPAFRFDKAFKVTREVKAFLILECGVTRGAVPNAERLRSALEQVEKQRQLLGKQNREITRLKMKLSTVDEARASTATGGPGALPDFLIIGAQKCGTTFLYNLLCQHPYVEPAATKEVHFFDTNFTKGVEWYRSRFSPPTQKEGRKVLTGESSPYYIYHPHAARRAAQVVPGTRLIALLRNPVDRAYSDYNHKAREGRESLSFEEAIAAEEERLRGEKEKMLADEGYASPNYRKFSYLSRGVYVDQLKEWRGYFDEEQLLVLKSEDFFENTQAGFERSLAFLGLPHWETRVSGERNEGEYEQMNPATRQRLEDYFEPHNKRLYEFLGVDLGW